MNVLVAIDNPTRTEHSLDMLRDHFSHFEKFNLIVAYPSDNPDIDVDEFESAIDDWKKANNSVPVYKRRVEGRSYQQRLLSVIEKDNIDHLIVGPQESSFRQRIFGDGPNKIFTECPVPITVTSE